MPVVLLHGWGDRLETFDQLTNTLSADYEVIRLDLAGFGKSQPPNGSWGLDEYAQYVATFLKKIDVSPFAILGHSNGGAVAVKAVVTGRTAPEKLILLSSAGIRNTKNARKFAWRVAAKTGKSAAAILPKNIQRSLRARLYQSAGSDIMVAPHMEETFKRIVAEDIQVEAAMLQLPTLIINGSSDEATPLQFAQIFHSAIENSQLVVLNDAGHFAHQEQADEVARAVKGFLKK